jgi:hypothetical protein
MTTMTYGKREQLTMTQTTGTKCAVCAKNKFQLRRRISKLSGQQMFVCNDCFENKYEPRWLIIITGQEEGGMEKIADYLLHHKYIGDEIPAADLVK